MNTPPMRCLLALLLFAKSLNTDAATTRPATGPATQLAMHVAADGPGVEIQTIDQITIKGNLQALSDGMLTVAVSDSSKGVAEKRISLDEIAELTVTSPAASQQQAQSPASKRSTGKPGRAVGMNPGRASEPGVPTAENEKSTTRPAASQAAATRPSSSSWIVTLTNGDIFRGPTVSWEEKTVAIESAWPSVGVIQFPVDQVREAWSGSQEQVKAAKAIKLEPGPEDAAFVVKDGNVIVVRGVALGLDDTSLRFKYSEQERKISLAKLVGVVLGTSEPKHDDRFFQAVELVDGDVVSGSWKSFDKQSLGIETNFGASIEIPLGRVKRVSNVNGRMIYVSDLKPNRVEEVPYFDRLMPFKADAALTGGPLKLVDGEYRKGLAVHSRCVLEYEISRQYESFAAKVGFQQPQGRLGQAVIRVLGDGQVLYEDLDARGDATKPAEVKVNVTGMNRLTLEVDFGKNEDTADRVVWANARLLREKHP